MAKIVGYIAQSLDGFIADLDHKVGWLDAYGAINYGEFSYDQFIKNIGTVVMGRKTYEFIINSGVDWPYKEQRSIIVTSHQLDQEIAGVESFSGDLSVLIAQLRQNKTDTWIVGGGQLQSSLIALGLMDQIEIFVMPVLIGEGVPLWPGIPTHQTAELIDATALEAGVVHLQYQFLSNK